MIFVDADGIAGFRIETPRAEATRTGSYRYCGAMNYGSSSSSTCWEAGWTLLVHIIYYRGHARRRSANDTLGIATGAVAG